MHGGPAPVEAFSVLSLDVEDVAIRDVVAKQQEAGLGVITDGEFRRATWHLDFM